MLFSWFGVRMGHAPTCRHDTHSSAMTEARRLANLNQGKQFFVLAATHLVESNNIRVEELTHEIPF